MLDIATGVVSHSFLSPPTHSVISSCWSFPSPLWQSCSRSLILCSRNKLFFYPQGLQNSQNILNLLRHHCNWQTPLELGFEEKVRLLTVHANHPSPKRFLGSCWTLEGHSWILNPMNSCSSRVLPLILEKAHWTQAWPLWPERLVLTSPWPNQSKPLEHNQTFVEMEEAQSFPWHLTLGGQTGRQLLVTISLPRGGWQ